MKKWWEQQHRTCDPLQSGCERDLNRLIGAKALASGKEPELQAQRRRERDDAAFYNICFLRSQLDPRTGAKFKVRDACDLVAVRLNEQAAARGWDQVSGATLERYWKSRGWSRKYEQVRGWANELEAVGKLEADPFDGNVKNWFSMH